MSALPTPEEKPLDDRVVALEKEVADMRKRFTTLERFVWIEHKKKLGKGKRSNKKRRVK